MMISLWIGCAQHVNSQTPSSSEPTSQPTSSDHLSAQTHKETDSAEWGRASFGQPVYPEDLHQKSDDEGVAVFAGGCFWCMEAPFETITGVVAVYSGYTGGVKDYPTYSQVSASRTRHLEAVLVYYRPSEVSYQKLVERFWRSVNPTQANGQFADIGLQYTTAIFALNDQQRQIATQSKSALNQSQKFF
jgi:methionine-S-sulfoxide reductase